MQELLSSKAKSARFLSALPGANRIVKNLNWGLPQRVENVGEWLL